MKILRLLLASLGLFQSVLYSQSAATSEALSTLNKLHYEWIETRREQKPPNADGSINCITRRSLSPEEARVVAAKIRPLLPDLDFSVSDASQVEIKRCSALVGALFISLKGAVPLKLTETQAELIETIRMYFQKVQTAIDEKWVWLGVSPNVSPPPGVPMSFSGMDPDVIKDPKLRQGYLDNIAAEQMKNLVNCHQQYMRQLRIDFMAGVANLIAPKKGEVWLGDPSRVPPNGEDGWTREDLMKHFTINDAYKAILDEALKERRR